MTELNINEILKLLPHRYPMLLVDRVVECDFDAKKIVAIKNVTASEPFFQGHFPDMPIMPGVLQLEAMAQTGGILLNQVFSKEGSIAYFLAIDKAKFRRVVQPGDTLRIEVQFLKARMKASKMKAVVTVDGEVASEAELMFAYAE